MHGRLLLRSILSGASMREAIARRSDCARRTRSRSLDHLFLLVQGAFDRLIRRLRRGGRPERVRRRLVVVQIDGLSRTVFDRALAEGHMPFVAKMLARGGHRLHPMSVGMPTSTPAFQMAAMYGVQPDIPGFHYHDKRRRADIHFPRAGHAAGVEAAHVAGRVGILRGGSVYGCVFTGSAENDLFSFARLTRPERPGRRPRAVRVRRARLGRAEGYCSDHGCAADVPGASLTRPAARADAGNGRRSRSASRYGCASSSRRRSRATCTTASRPSTRTSSTTTSPPTRSGPRTARPSARSSSWTDRSVRSAGPAARPRAPVRPLRPVRSRPGAVEAVRAS